jgi:ParB/RepB/Spo0J family partition protein
MPKLEVPRDFARVIAETLGAKVEDVEEYFVVDEDKQGFFTAKLQPKKWLDLAQFKMLCAMARDYGGEYIKEARTWKIPGPYAKKPQALETSKTVATGSTETPKPVTTSTPAGSVVPDNVKYDKSKPPESGPLPVKLGYFEKFAIEFILSPKFSFRLNIEDDIQELVEQIATSRAGDELCVIAEPLICRPSTTPGYIEIGAGERRLLAARKMGLGVVPVIIKNFNDEEFDRIRMMENLARKDLTDYEVGRAIKHLMETYPKVYPTQANIAEVFGKTQGWVSQRLAMLQLPENITRVIKQGELTEKQAREILAAPEEKREEILDKISETGEVPSAREIRRAVQPEREAETEKGVGFEPTTLPEEVPVRAPQEPEPLLTGFEVECPECHVKLLINHVHYPSGKVEHEVET